MVTCLSLTFIPNGLNAMPPDSLKTELPAEAKSLMNRLEEIKSMDKSDLGWKEKRELRKEVKTIEYRLRDIGGTVYISVGALLIIIILLILLL